MYHTRLQYAPDAGGSSPSLADMDKPPIQGGDGTTKPADLAEEAAKQDAAAQSQQQADPKKEPQEGVNEDGSLQEGYERNEQGEVVKKEPAAAEEETASEEGDEDFFAEVDKLRGEPIELDYPEGMDPMSPEGVYHREKFLEQRAAEHFEAHLQKTDPRGYAYLLHRQAGGSDEEFFQQKSLNLPDYEEFKQNADLHVSVYRNALQNKGLDPESVQLLVDKAVKDKKIFELADAAYRTEQARYEKELADLEAQNQAATRKYQQSVQALDATLVSSISEGKDLNLVIPDADKKGFLEFVRSRVEYDSQTGKFLFVQPASEELARQLEAMYLVFKKGDLSALIKREAQTQNRKRLGQAVKGGKTGKIPTAGEQRQDQKGFVPLGSL